ncbi:MAG: T9SS type A sorting domain-containing protein [Bacteroidetes bacterium]|nr:T9SS type A sorting domain-containing protein [Bacteroidota bacterium]
MKIIYAFFLSAISLLIATSTLAQDTTTVQCFDFDDITKRRGTYSFPDASEEFSKILMVYTLKCDPRTTRDGHDCGEWDYLTYTKLYHHDGLIDSTYKTHPTFKVGTTTPATYAYKMTPSYDLTLDKQFSIRHTATQSVVRDTVGSGTVNTASALKTSELSGRSQYLWKAAELTSNGMSAGSISGLQIAINSLGTVLSNFEIRLGHTTLDSLSGDFVQNMTTVYRHSFQFTAVGYKDIQFTNNFSWNGNDNLIVEFLFDNNTKGSDFGLNATATSFASGIEQSGSEYYLDLSGNQQYVNIGQSAQVLGNNPRTIEMWARVDAFNNGGLFQAGRASSGADFSLRTLGTDDRFRMQQFGPSDFDFNYAGAKDIWHHYAVVRSGGTTTVYIDGVNAGNESSAISTIANDMFLGRWQGRYLNGAIKEFRIWDKALSLTEITDWHKKTVTTNHPSYTNLVAYYDLNEAAGNVVLDKSSKNLPDGSVLNYPIRKRILAEDLMLNATSTNIRPNIIFEQGVYTSVLDSVFVTDTLFKAPSVLYTFGNPASGKKIADNDPKHPSIASDTTLVWEANILSYTYDRKTGAVLYSRNITPDVTLNQENKEWYSPEVTFELARFITPYGIRLDLGPEGFTWFYDVTDYRHLLADSVDISAGNQQELIDLKFLMIKGKPARKVLAMNRVWGTYRSYRYDQLSDDRALPPVKVKEHADAEYMMLKTRLTGHGHNSSDGNYPHCCEWKDNTHYVAANGQPAKNWHIWQATECAENPVYPQGGTWPGAREGWCPGDVVKETDVDLTAFMGNDSIEVDYNITPVPTSNLGMGSGNYIVGMHLFQYGPAAYKNDVEVYDVLNPTSKRIHSRRSTTCKNPSVIIRNGGSESLTSAVIKYRVSGGLAQEYKWNGQLEFMEKQEIELPVDAEWFYSGDGSNLFEVSVGYPNGLDDENELNNTYQTKFELPAMYPSKIVVQLQTNARANENSMTIKDMDGRVVLDRSSLTNSTQTKDTLALADGCYTLELTDSGNDGLSYWANTAQGNGQLLFLILNEEGNISSITPFNADFGRSIKYSFTIGSELNEIVDGKPDSAVTQWEFDKVGQEESNLEWGSFNVFPNPAQHEVTIEMLGQEGLHQLEVISTSGQVVLSQELDVSTYKFEIINISELPKGLYHVRMLGENKVYNSRFVKD